MRRIFRVAACTEAAASAASGRHFLEPSAGRIVEFCEDLPSDAGPNSQAHAAPLSRSQKIRNEPADIQHVEPKQDTVRDV